MKKGRAMGQSLSFAARKQPRRNPRQQRHRLMNNGEVWKINYKSQCEEIMLMPSPNSLGNDTQQA